MTQQLIRILLPDPNAVVIARVYTAHTHDPEAALLRTIPGTLVVEHPVLIRTHAGGTDEEPVQQRTMVPWLGSGRFAALRLEQLIGFTTPTPGQVAAWQEWDAHCAERLALQAEAAAATER